MSLVTSWPRAPSQGRTTAWPPPIAALTTWRTMVAGMAKPTPAEPPDCDRMKVLMPIRSPSMSTSGPPELPGLIAASVWM